ncbi:hypothetical protein [Streptomyces sp. enrichment culture]|uniref:hypothetical protein n=1 Tax=Streptomyces sp. enrichment culture TaxID=1795815 RepID=UPI003F56F73F
MDWGGLVPGVRLSRVSRVHFVLAWCLSVAAMLITVVAWLPGPSRVPTWAEVAVFVAAFPVYGAAVLRAVSSPRARTLLYRGELGNGMRLLRFARAFPTGLQCAYALVLAVFALALVTGGMARATHADESGRHSSTQGRAPEQRSEAVGLTDAGHHEVRKAQVRVFTSGAMLFHAAAGFLVLVAAPAIDPWREQESR